MSAVAPARPAVRTAAKAPARAPATRPRETGTRSQTRPALRLVAAPRAAATRLPFALLVAAILGGGLVALLMLHTLAAQDGFTVHKLQRQSAALSDLEQQLTVANQQAQGPSTLASRARALGMVPTGDLHIIRRHNGRLVAVATAVVLPRPAPRPTTTASAAATPSGAPSTAATPSPASSRQATQPRQTTQPSAKPRAPH